MPDQTIPTHPSNLLPKFVEKVYKRRGSLYAFPSLNPAKTALVVIDLDMGTGRDDPIFPQIAEKVNMLAATLREHGGTVAWVTTPIQKGHRKFPSGIWR